VAPDRSNPVAGLHTFTILSAVQELNGPLDTLYFAFGERRLIMHRARLLTVLTVVLFISGTAMPTLAIAGEKFKAHGAGTTVKWEQIEVGDVEGHVIGITQNKAVYFNELTGEITPHISVGLMDFNLNTGIGSGHGYGISILKNGDKRITRWEGKFVEKGHMKGTLTLIMGTGKLQGIKGGGTWESHDLGSGQSYIETEGEMEIPNQ